MVHNLKEVIANDESPIWHYWEEDELTNYWKSRWGLKERKVILDINLLDGKSILKIL